MAYAHLESLSLSLVVFVIAFVVVVKITGPIHKNVFPVYFQYTEIFAEIFKDRNKFIAA